MATVGEFIYKLGFKLDSSELKKAEDRLANAATKLKDNFGAAMDNLSEDVVEFAEDAKEALDTEIEIEVDEASVNSAEKEIENLAEDNKEVLDDNSEIQPEVDKQSKAEAEAEIQDLASKAKKLLGVIGIGFSIKGAFEAIKACVSVSSEVEEMQNKFDVVFNGMTAEAEAWAQSYADSVGRNSNTIKGYMADTQNLLVGMGMQREEGAKLSEQMIELALDLASFNNLNETDAVNAMTKALMGESESAKTLGAVLNDNTRAQAMLSLGLSGTYQELDEATKMQVNYQAILNQSSDAVGDCERSLDSYESTLKQTTAKLEEIKTLVGQFFMPVFQKVLSFANIGLIKLRDWITKLQTFADKVGGAEHLLKLLAAAGAALVVALNFNKIVSGAQSLLKMLGGINLKMLAIIAVVVLLVLLVDDFINFMQGNNSVIGTLLENAGVDVEEVREKIVNVWNTIKTTLQSIWEFIKGVGLSIWGALQTFWDENGESIKSSLLEIWESVSTSLSSIWESIKSIAESVFSALQAFWDAWGEKIMSAFSVVWEGVQSLFMTALDVVTSLFAAFAALLSGDWEGFWESIKGFLEGILEGVVTIISSALEAIWALFGDIIPSIIAFIGAALDLIWTTVTDKTLGIKDALVNGFNAAVEWLKELPGKALTWGKDFIQGLIDGIKEKVSGVVDAVKGVAETITSWLHFSVPDEGPLKEYGQWMPDFMKGLAQGIKDNEDLVTGAISKLSGDIEIGVNGKVNRGTKATGVTARTAASVVNNNGGARVINQTNNFNNSFSGGEREAQRSMSKTAKANAKDTTAELARALKFA